MYKRKRADAHIREVILKLRTVLRELERRYYVEEEMPQSKTPKQTDVTHRKVRP